MVRWLVLASQVLALAINCAAYLVLRRAFGSSLAVSIFGGLGFGFVVVVTVALESLRYADIDPVESLICQIGTYLALSFCFWTFLNLNVASLRIRVMRDLLQSGGTAAVSDVLRAYSDAERLQRRLVRLSNGGQIELVNGNWRLRSSLILSLARCIDLIRAIMGQGGNSNGNLEIRPPVRT
jgi:hypothetical protein